MANLKRPAFTWYSIVAALGGLSFWAAVRGTETLVQHAAWPLAVLAVAIWFGLQKTVRLSKGEFHSVYTLDDAPTFAVIFLFPTAIATLVVGALRFTHELVRVLKAVRKHPSRVTLGNVLYHFSDVAFVAFATLCAGACLDFFGRPSPLTGLAGASAALVAGGVWFLILFALNSLHLSVFLGTPHSWFQQSVKSLRQNIATAALFLPIGILMSVFLVSKPWMVPLLFVPVLLIHTVMEASDKLEFETEQTILALSTYLEERDDYTSGHSRRVAGYAAAMASEIGLTPQEVETTHRAGLIHDLGKIDVPDAILRKPGMLNETERAVMRTHTDRAVELGEKLVALKKGLPFHLAAYHHENFDGTGYYRMSGEDIPLVSRMLAVADTFDAMTSDRPYRKGMGDSEAILRLKKAAGTQLDPHLVTAFLKVYDKGRIDRVRSQVPVTEILLAG